MAKKKSGSSQSSKQNGKKINERFAAEIPPKPKNVKPKKENKK
jgi:hypothetical protein